MSRPDIPIPAEAVEAFRDFVRDRLATWVKDEEARAACAAMLAAWPRAHVFVEHNGASYEDVLILPLPTEPSK